MAMFNSYVKLPECKSQQIHHFTRLFVTALPSCGACDHPQKILMTVVISQNNKTNVGIGNSRSLYIYTYIIYLFIYLFLFLYYIYIVRVFHPFFAWTPPHIQVSCVWLCCGRSSFLSCKSLGQRSHLPSSHPTAMAMTNPSLLMSDSPGWMLDLWGPSHGYR